MKLRSLSHVVLKVSDLERSVAFYRDVRCGIDHETPATPNAHSAAD